ncbi:Protein of unknown function [Pyronema omphalodes CBS 100304]|uniref:Uncharacterized protein n=1 Tax=Pyronema omphalodes (strain CBS 100304) TaxID=1076935 RepID=U4L9F8_PYROM|nr:Protein of unknown function [Pyronema omphalodes CBS 100304]
MDASTQPFQYPSSNQHSRFDLTQG